MYPTNIEVTPRSAPYGHAPQPAMYAPQPTMAQHPVMGPGVVGTKPGQWSTGLCGCIDDPSNCCITCWCPCITFGQNAEIIDRGTTSCVFSALMYYIIAHVLCPCLYTCAYRTKLRALYALNEDPCADCCVHLCCHWCAICQEYRELKNRGLDPSVGWIANAQRLNQGGLAVPPTVVPGMYR